MPPNGLRPMAEFNPYEPAILHEILSDSIVTWDWEQAEDFNRSAIYDSLGRVCWAGQVFDGWGNVLGG
jgi:hypothetical protein